MASEWHYRKGDKQHGPVSASVLKSLAASGNLSPSDMVKKAESEDWTPASSVRGLFAPSKTNSVAIAASKRSEPRSAAAKPDNTTPKKSSGPPPPINANETKSDNKGFMAKLSKSAGAATKLVALQAERTKLNTLTLPAAYRALGKDCLQQKRHLDCVPELMSQLRSVLAEIKQLSEMATTQDAPKSFTDKAKAAGKQALDVARTKQLGMKRDSIIAGVGKGIYEQHSAGSGPIELVAPIQKSLARIAQLDAEIGQQSQIGKGSVLTPKRMLLGVGVVLIVFMANWLLRSNSSSPYLAEATSSDLATKQFLLDNKSIGQTKPPQDAMNKSALATSPKRNPFSDITAGITQSAIESQARQDKKILDDRNEMEAEQARLADERAEKAKRNEELLSKANKEKAAIEMARKERSEVVRKNTESLFQSFSFDPSKSILLSKSLTKLSADVEIIGPDYQMLRTLHEKSDWLGLVNYVHHTKNKLPLLTDLPDGAVSSIVSKIAAPDAGSVEEMFHFVVNLDGDFTSMNEAMNDGIRKPYLFAFEIPIRRETLDSWEFALKSESTAFQAGHRLGCRGAFKLNNKNGQVFNWTPLSLFIVGIDSNPSASKPFFFMRKINEQKARFMTQLDTQSQSMDRKNFEAEVNRELGNIYRQITEFMKDY